MRWSLVLLFTLLFFELPTFADTILFANSPDATLDGLGISGLQVADDFNLLSAAVITGIDLSAITYHGTVVGSLDWAILSDNNGSPGSVLFSGISYPTNTLQYEATWFGGAQPADVNSVFITTPGLDLIAGIYYLQLGNAGTANGTAVTWVATSTGFTPDNTGQTSINGTYLNSYYKNTVFSIYGNVPTPEPASILLVGGGLGALVRRLRQPRRRA